MTVRLLLLAVLLLVDIQPAHAATAPRLVVTYPTNYQTFQRDNTNHATITITGWYVGNPRRIEASWRGQPWNTIDSTLPRGSGRFRGTLTVPAGQGTLLVRSAGTRLVDKVWVVGVGDIYVMAGQSNMMGYGFRPHQYNRTNIRATMLGNNDRWGELRDPYDTNIGQVDRVSADRYRMGSFVAWIANAHIRRTGVPLAIIPAAKGGSSIEQWKRSTSRYTLYGSMLRRVNKTGGKAKAVLWFQGESNGATSVESYRDSLSGLADNINRDFRGAKLVPAIIGPHHSPGLYRTGPRIGVVQAVETNPNVVMGPAVYDINLDDEGGDGTHFRSDRDLAKAGYRFWQAIDHAFYGGEVGYGPELQETTLNGTTVRLRFDSDVTVTANPETFWVHDDGTRTPVTDVDSNGDTIELTLGAIPTGQVTVSYGHDNRSAVGAAVYNRHGLPAVPFHEVEPEQVEPLVETTREPAGPEPTVEPSPSVEPVTPTTEPSVMPTPAPTPESSATPTTEPTPGILEGLIPNE